MRGSSDLESVWETRIGWSRDGQAPTVTLKPEHREAEAGDPISYRIVYDHDTRSMRFNLVDNEAGPTELEQRVGDYLREHPDASANKVHDAVGGKRQDVLALVKRIGDRQVRDAVEALTVGGSQGREPPGNHPP
jgi:hypothetical protein